MIKKVLVGEMVRKNRVSCPVKIKVRPILADEFCQADMVIAVGIKEGGYGKLGQDYYGYPGKECSDEGDFIAHVFK